MLSRLREREVENKMVITESGSIPFSNECVWGGDEVDMSQILVVVRENASTEQVQGAVAG